MSFGLVNAQCDINTSASQYEIYCGESVDLSAFGSSTGEVVLEEDFETGGFGPGWNGSPQATFSSPSCTGGPVQMVIIILLGWVMLNQYHVRLLLKDMICLQLLRVFLFVLTCYSQSRVEEVLVREDEPDEGVFRSIQQMVVTLGGNPLFRSKWWV